MKDHITLDRIQTIHPLLRDELSKIYDEICTALAGKAICRFAYVIRSFAEQEALYAQGRTAAGKVITNAKAGQSYHNYGLAVDIVLLKDINSDGTFNIASWENNVDFDGDGQPDWMEIVRIFKYHSWAWGGDFHSIPDKPHFEKSLGYSVGQLLEKYNEKTFIENSNYLKL